jgi:DNA sulfur modification protein DndD
LTGQEVLRIKSVTIKNFRAYYGDSGPILFSRDQESPVTIFHGTNGLGKTSMFNAIHWGIYGKERKSKDHKIKSEGLVNSYVIDSLKEGVNDEMFVKIQIENQNEDLQYEIQRKILLSKEGISSDLIVSDVLGGNVPRYIVANSEVSFSYKDPDSDDDELIKTKNPITVSSLLKKIFPRQLSNFFLLDGELLDDFMNSNDVFIKNGIEQISQLPLLVNSVKHIKFTSNKVGTSATSNRTNYTMTQDKISNKEKIKDKLQEDLPQTISEIKTLDRQLEDGIKLILKYDEETVANNQTLIETNKTALKVLELNIKENKSKIQNLVYNNLDKILMKNAYDSATSKYKKYVEEKKLPSKFSKDILEQLLHTHECVCGRNLDEDKNAIDAIQDMLNVSYDSTLGVSMNKIVDQTSDIVNNFANDSSLVVEINTLNNQISKYRQARIDVKGLIEKLEKELDKINSKELEEIRTNNDKLKIKIKDKNNIVHEKNILLEGLTTELGKLERDFVQLKRLTIKDDHAVNKMNLAQYIQTTLNKAHEQLRKEFVEQVQSATQELFMKTAPQARVFESISIDKNTFAISALRAKDKSKDLSRGQAHVLGISFINAIRTITTKNYFMIIDSPFNNISQRERIDICDEIPTSHKNTQLTFLVTDSEYEADVKKTDLPSVRETLKKHNMVGCEYNLIQKPLATIKSEEYFKTSVEDYT